MQNHSLKAKTDLKIRCYYFSIEIMKLAERFPQKRVYWIISDQLLRAATSIGANIMEAKAASSRRDFIKFYNIALKSANETKYWLGILRDGSGFGKRNKIIINNHLKEVKEISNMFGASLLTLRNKRK